jgi:hypothetical protein
MQHRLLLDLLPEARKQLEIQLAGKVGFSLFHGLIFYLVLFLLMGYEQSQLMGNELCRAKHQSAKNKPKMPKKNTAVYS